MSAGSRTCPSSDGPTCTWRPARVPTSTTVYEAPLVLRQSVRLLSPGPGPGSDQGHDRHRGRRPSDHPLWVMSVRDRGYHYWCC